MLTPDEIAAAHEVVRLRLVHTKGYEDVECANLHLALDVYSQVRQLVEDAAMTGRNWVLVSEVRANMVRK